LPADSVDDDEASLDDSAETKESWKEQVAIVERMIAIGSPNGVLMLMPPADELLLLAAPPRRSSWSGASRQRREREARCRIILWTVLIVVSKVGRGEGVKVADDY
jgi:hypothetical protein